MKRAAIALLAATAALAACTLPLDAKPKPCSGYLKNAPGCSTTTTAPPTTTTTTAPTTTTTTSTTTTVPPAPGGDETPAVLAALQATGRFHVDRTYLIDSPLVPPAGSTITFGPGGKFVRGDGGYGTRKWPVIELTHGDITILDPVIEGPNTGRYEFRGETYAQEGTGIGGVDPNMEESGGFYFSGGSNYYIRNPRISSVWGDGITIIGGASNIVIDNPAIWYVGRSLVSNLDSTNVTINDGEGGGAFWWGFNMEPVGSRVVQTYRVNGFDLYWNRYDQVFADGPYFNCQVYDVIIDVDWRSDWQGVRIDPCVAGEVTVR